VRTRIPQARSRQVVIGLDKARNPVAARIAWLDGEEIVRYIGVSVAPFVSFDELLVELDRLPRHVSCRDLDEMYWCARGWVEHAMTAVKFDMPGWCLTGMAGVTVWEEQFPVPF